MSACYRILYDRTTTRFTNHLCADSRRRRGWSEYQEGHKTKSYSSRKSPDKQSFRHTPTSRQTYKTNCTVNETYKTNFSPSSDQSYQTTTTTTGRILLGLRSDTDNRARGFRANWTCSPYHHRRPVSKKVVR